MNVKEKKIIDELFTYIQYVNINYYFNTLLYITVVRVQCTYTYIMYTYIFFLNYDNQQNYQLHKKITNISLRMC